MISSLKRARMAQGLSQQDLAKRTGIHYIVLGCIERRERNPSFKSAVTIAKALGLPVEEVFSDYID